MKRLTIGECQDVYEMHGITSSEHTADTTNLCMVIAKQDKELAELKAELKAIKKVCEDADRYLNTNSMTNIGHGSILHSELAAAWRDKDPHDHDGCICSASCNHHITHPCEQCGRQWPQAKAGK